MIKKSAWHCALSLGIEAHAEQSGCPPYNWGSGFAFRVDCYVTSCSKLRLKQIWEAYSEQCGTKADLRSSSVTLLPITIEGERALSMLYIAPCMILRVVLGH